MYIIDSNIIDELLLDVTTLTVRGTRRKGPRDGGTRFVWFARKENDVFKLTFSIFFYSVRRSIFLIFFCTRESRSREHPRTRTDDE